MTLSELKAWMDNQAVVEELVLNKLASDGYFETCDEDNIDEDGNFFTHFDITKSHKGHLQITAYFDNVNDDEGPEVDYTAEELFS